ncbi:MAG: NADH-quinone oxidoreductase subunit NuoH [bacterium]|nr:NADH-quinone oxidoreductase subunit NuoH [bacterium]
MNPLESLLPGLPLIVWQLVWASIIVAFVTVFALIAVYLERKISAYAQDRYGPMEAGGWGFQGWAQTLADAIKLLLKEDIIPALADPKLFKLAPYIVFAGSLGVLAVIPFATTLVGSDLNIGIYYAVALSSTVVIGILMAGWASNNKWALYGAMRSAAQMISYEIPISLSLMLPVMLAGSLSFNEIMEAQRTGFPGDGYFWNWYLFRVPPFTIIAFIIYFWASLAETNRTPFDIPESESELVAGYHTEYTGIRFAMFFLAEYANMFIVAAIASVVFLGGALAPAPWLSFIPGPAWLILKAMVIVFVQIWLRWTLPRVRVDQLMHICWKIFLPLALVNFIAIATVAAIWQK